MMIDIKLLEPGDVPEVRIITTRATADDLATCLRYETGGDDTSDAIWAALGAVEK